MKTRYVVVKEIPSERGITTKDVKSFRNESEALAFYTNPKNQRAYGVMYLEMRNAEGNSTWDDNSESWGNPRKDS